MSETIKILDNKSILTEQLGVTKEYIDQNMYNTDIKYNISYQQDFFNDGRLINKSSTKSSFNELLFTLSWNKNIQNIKIESIN